MKTIESLRQNNKDLMSYYKNTNQYSAPEAKKGLDKAKKQIQLNNKAILALEQGMTKEIIEKSLRETKSKLNLLEFKRNFHVKSNDEDKLKELKKEYDKKMGIPQLKKQIKFIQFLLK